MSEQMYNPLQIQILDLLKQNGPLPRSALVQFLQKPRTTLYDNLLGLLNTKCIKKFSRPNHTRGRPTVFFKIQEE